MDIQGEDVIDNGNAFHIFGNRKSIVNCLILVPGRYEVENELRFFGHQSEINLVRARAANDGDRKT